MVSNALERSRNTLKGISSLSIFDIILSINSKVAYSVEWSDRKPY